MSTLRRKTGVLLLNLGTPDSPEPKEVGAYLREFLMDPYVIDIPYLWRWILVHTLIVPRRSHASSALYRKIWQEEGSPLLIYLRALQALVQKELGDSYFVEAAMRYGKPSIESALASVKAQGVDRLIAFPLYPQYSLAATESSQQAVRRMAERILPGLPVDFVGPFYAEGAYLDAVAEVSRPHLSAQEFDRVLFSFHGLPERQVKKTDRTGAHCLGSSSCSEAVGEANRDCYRAQCFATARELASRLGIERSRYDVGFQSRLGRTPWIQPYSDAFYRQWPAQGVKRVAVLCPSFVADCLETVEEVRLRGKDEFLRHGGEVLELVPSLNDSSIWASAVAQLVGRLLGQPVGKAGL